MSQPPIHLEHRDQVGARLYSTTAARNSAPIAEVLAREIPNAAHVLEIGSGTGEQARAVCVSRPDIIWQCSDPDAESRASQAAWLSDLEQAHPAPINLDMLDARWTKNLRSYDALYCANVIHIAPAAVTEGLARGAQDVLNKEGAVFLYGPFLFGSDSAESNLAFDGRLKAKNPDWGVRELEFVKHIFALQGFNLSDIIAMPANNHILKFITS